MYRRKKSNEEHDVKLLMIIVQHTVQHIVGMFVPRIRDDRRLNLIPKVHVQQHSVSKLPRTVLGSRPDFKPELVMFMFFEHRDEAR